MVNCSLDRGIVSWVKGVPVREGNKDAAPVGRWQVVVERREDTVSRARDAGGDTLHLNQQLETSTTVTFRDDFGTAARQGWVKPQRGHSVERCRDHHVLRPEEPIRAIRQVDTDGVLTKSRNRLFEAQVSHFVRHRVGQRSGAL